MQRRPLGIALAASLVGCAAPEVAVERPAPAITTVVSSPSIEVGVGGAQLVVVSVIRRDGFTGEITLVVDGAPAGLRGLQSEIRTVNGVSSALMAVSAGTTLAPGSYPVTVRAIAFGADDAVASLRKRASECLANSTVDSDNNRFHRPLTTRDAMRR